MNILFNYTANTLITVDDKDPPWINEYIKRKIMDKKVACTSFNTNQKNYDPYLKLHTISTEFSEMVLKRKDDYNCQISDKLNDPDAKEDCSILKTIMERKSH